MKHVGINLNVKDQCEENYNTPERYKWRLEKMDQNCTWIEALNLIMML